jgi:hypothetical protein
MGVKGGRGVGLTASPQSLIRLSRKSGILDVLQPYRLQRAVSFYIFFNLFYSVRRVPCDHSSARPRVADGGDGLQTWRVSANILNTESRTADTGWSSSFRVLCGTNH